MANRGGGALPLLLLLLLQLLSFLPAPSPWPWPLLLPQALASATYPQSCSTSNTTTRRCRALVTYFPINNLFLSDIASLFSLPYTQLLGPNDFNLSLPDFPHLVLPKSQPFLVPFDCGCRNSTLVATSVNYSVVKGDTLSTIADTYYSHLLTYPEIGDASGVKDYNLIQINQSLTIPIPCACATDNGTTQQSVELLSYQIQDGDNLTKIARDYDTTEAELQRFNGGAVNNTDLLKQNILFVPLSVCKANFSSTAIDNNLQVINGKYELTANNCVQCNCNNGSLYCIPSNFSSDATNACGSLTCPNSNLTIGAFNTSQSSGQCRVQSCIYDGYSNSTGILSRLETDFDPTCPAPPPPESVYNPPNDLVASPLHAPSTPSTPTSQPSTPSASPPTTPPSNSPPPIAGSLFSSSCNFLVLVVACFWAPFLM